MSDDFEILTFLEGSQFIKRKETAVRKLIMRKKIPHRKIAGRIIFIKSELEKWIENSDGVRLEDLK